MKTIISNYSRYATIHEDGRIERLDDSAGPSESWKITGAMRLNNRGYVIERYSLEDVLSGRITDWQHKNGKQFVHLTDLDHGTHRMWASPHHSVV